MKTARRTSAWMMLLAAVIALVGRLTPATAVLAQPPANSTPVALVRPTWQVHDHWVIETLTQRAQVREEKPAAAPPKVRWSFTVAGVEKIAGRQCYRIDIQCLAKGGRQPETKLWCDQETLFIRQFQTTMPGAGRQWPIQESYATPADQLAPVLAPLTAIPLAIPAFVQQQAKANGEFTYTSQAAPAAAKDAGLLRFAHTTRQAVRPPGAKALRQVPAAFAKDLEQQPIREVELRDQQQTIVQLWRQGAPWPVYASNGVTEAWLVPDDDDAANR